MQDYPAGAGSGIVWDKQGHVVTNYHVIKGASTVQVRISAMVLGPLPPAAALAPCKLLCTLMCASLLQPL